MYESEQMKGIYELIKDSEFKNEYGFINYRCPVCGQEHKSTTMLMHITHQANLGNIEHQDFKNKHSKQIVIQVWDFKKNQHE